MSKNEKLSIYVDIDNTIAISDKTDIHDYQSARPIQENINIINKLFEEGNTITYWTARGSVSGIDWKPTTEQQLKKWGCKYHELKMGKPFYHILVDDRACNAHMFFQDVLKNEKKGVSHVIRENIQRKKVSLAREEKIFSYPHLKKKVFMESVEKWNEKKEFILHKLRKGIESERSEETLYDVLYWITKHDAFSKEKTAEMMNGFLVAWKALPPKAKEAINNKKQYEYEFLGKYMLDVLSLIVSVPKN
jgi:hypothetical protein